MFERLTRTVDPIEGPILDPLNDFELAILKTIKENPGLNVPKLLDALKTQYPDVTIDKIKNTLKRHLTKYAEFVGSRNGGGHKLKTETEK